MSEEKDRFSIIDALSIIFEGYGARAALSNTDPKYLRVVHGDIRIAVGFLLSGNPPTASKIGEFLAQTIDAYYHLFVFVSNRFYTEDAVDYASKHNIILLGREDLEKELGKAYLKEIEIFHYSPVPMEGSREMEALVRRGLNVPARAAEKRPELIRVLEFYREKNTPRQRMPSEDLIKIVEEAKEEERPQEERKPEGIIIRPEVPLSGVREMGTKIGRITASQMELIPYFLFGYTCRIFEEGGTNVKESSGLLAVNGITLEVEEWEPGFRTVDEIQMDYIRLVPRADRKVAKDLAFNGVIQLNTRILEVTTESNGIQRNGKKKKFPDPSSVKLNYEGLYYFPHWHIKGEEGSMFVDAVNGEVISVQKG